MKHLDETRFTQQAGGNPLLMVRIAQAFAGQLPGWRAEFAAASASSATLIALMHKMKGSCQAITAFEAAETFAQAEKDLQLTGKPSDTTLVSLLALLAELEADLTSLIQQHDRAVP